MKLFAAAIAPTGARLGLLVPATPPCELIEPPIPHSRMWVADHLGLAADALAAATTQLGRVAPGVIGNYLSQSSRELCELMPDAHNVFSPESGVAYELEWVNSAIQSLSSRYFLKDRMPPDSVSPGWLLARYTYTVRHAQDLLEGIGS